MLRPASDSMPRNGAGYSFTSAVRKCVASERPKCSYQPSVICVSKTPLPGKRVGNTTSYALKRSVDTMSRRSPRSKTSRTLPARSGLSPSSTVVPMAFDMLLFRSEDATSVDFEFAQCEELHRSHHHDVFFGQDARGQTFRRVAVVHGDGRLHDNGSAVD